MVIFISKYCFILGKVGHMTNCNRLFVPARHGTIGHVTNLVKDITFKKMFHIPGYQLITFYTFLPHDQASLVGMVGVAVHS